MGFDCRSGPLRVPVPVEELLSSGFPPHDMHKGYGLYLPLKKPVATPRSDCGSHVCSHTSNNVWRLESKADTRCKRSEAVMPKPQTETTKASPGHPELLSKV